MRHVSRTDGIIILEVIEGNCNLGHKRGTECVECFWAVERNQANAVVIASPLGVEARQQNNLETM